MESTKTDLIDFLRRQDLLRASLVVGKIQSIVFEVEPFAEVVLELSAKLWTKVAHQLNDPIAVVHEINQLLFKEFGMQGKGDKTKNVIDDPHRYYLHSVLERKTGSPLAITLLYSILCQQVKFQYQVIALPSYYYLKISDAAGNFYIDPFDSGALISEEDFQKKLRGSMQKNRLLQSNLFEQITDRQLVSKLVQQLKHIYIIKNQAIEALYAVEILTSLFPDSPELTRDRGILYCEIEYFSRAIHDLKYYLKCRPNAEDVGEIKKLATMLKGYREVVN